MSVLLFSNVNSALFLFSNITYYYQDRSLFTCEWRNSRKSLRIESVSYFHRYSVFDDDSNCYLLKSLDFASTANKSRFVVDITYRWTFRRSIIVYILNFLRLLLKWISSYFVEKKFVSWPQNHVVKISCNFFLCLCCTSAHLHLLRIKLMLSFFCCSHMFSRFVLKNKYNMSEIKNFCEISAFIMLIAFVFSSKVIDDRRFFRKLSIHWIIQFDIFFQIV